MSQYLDDRAFMAALPVAFKELEALAHEEQKLKAERIKEVAQHYTPVAEGVVPATEHPGELREGIKVTEGVEEGKPFVDVGVRTADVPYANYVHWGTSRMRGTPFLLIAIAQET